MRADEGGNFWFLIAAAVGAVTGAVGQVVADLATSALTGNLQFSNWQTYTGAAVGGAVSGLVLATTGNLVLAGAACGAVTTFVGQSLEKVTIPNYDKSWAEIGMNTLVDGAVGAGTGAIPGINKIAKGRNSMMAVFKSGMTKMIRGSATRMSARVAIKGATSIFVGGLALDGYYGLKQAYYNSLKSVVSSVVG